MLMIYFHNPNDNSIGSEMMKDLNPDEAQEVGCLSVIWYVVAIIIVLCVFAIFGSCKSQNNIVTEHKARDSIRVDVRYKTIIVPDTVFIEIPAQTSERTTADSTSHLENDYATSDARINPDGTMFHLLATKPHKKPVEVDKKIEQRDSIVYVEKSNTETGQQIVEVERQLSWWEKTSIYGFYLLAALLVVIYRKQIWSILRKFIIIMPH